MIQIETVHIEEFRGIRDLTLQLNRKNFVISGPNGSGKSGVVDAIQFALTGEIARLKGAGTGDLSLSTHGPHVEKRDYPDAAFVTLDVFIPSLGKKASITRTIRKPNQPVITPCAADVVEVFKELAQHPELTLSRREIIRFILAEATQRSRDVQTLLKLDDIDQTRATLKTTENRLNQAAATTKVAADSAEAAIKRHLDLPELKADQLLEVVNRHRKLLALPILTELRKNTSLSGGVPEDAATPARTVTKETVLRDLRILLELVKNCTENTRDATESILENLGRLDADPMLLTLIKQRPFIRSGIDLIAGPHCPLCDKDWDLESLRHHLEEKLRKSDEANVIQTTLLDSGRNIAREIQRIRAQIAFVRKVPEADKALITKVSEWTANLEVFGDSLETVEGLISVRKRMAHGWTEMPPKLVNDFEKVEAAVKSRPDQSATDQAREFLVVAQERMSNWRAARRDAEEKKVAASRGKVAYATFCEVAEANLDGLYRQVEGDFSDYYRLINQDDEGEFGARLEASEGKLGLLVDFYQKGMFPPGAYHSEGHQDGMGVCLYLALMKRVLGTEFTIAVLDDVVMSVDMQHRRQFCKLLKSRFPNTQFVITTHDRVWASQMRSEGVINAKSAIAFHTWTVDAGPILDEVTEVWELIDADLAKNEVPAAAGRLRRHLEFVSGQLADELGARVSYRGDGGYDMGDLLSAVIGRQGELLKEAAQAAKSWNNQKDIEKVQTMQETRKECLIAWGGEQWIINKAVHYNEWANLSRDDFRPVVNVIRTLLTQFRCPNLECDTWLYITPKKEPADLRCACGSIRLNLTKK